MIVLSTIFSEKRPGVLEDTIPGFFWKKFRRRPTLPLSHPSSTIGAKELNFRVRDGNGCLLFAIATEKVYFQKCDVLSNLDIGTIKR
jgi:hypothetical protein